MILKLQQCYFLEEKLQQCYSLEEETINHITIIEYLVINIGP